MTTESERLSAKVRYCKKCGAELPSNSKDKYCLQHQKGHDAEKQAVFGIGMAGLAVAIKQGAKKYGPKVASAAASLLSNLKK